jgi:malonyl CoA-acyl carrier protein transacylase
MRCLLVCPGRGSYMKDQLGSLVDAPLLRSLDAVRESAGRPTLSELDRVARFSARLHVAGENASLLTFAATAQDVRAVDPDRVRLVGVAGNSLGFYSALWAAGSLDLSSAARLVDTMGAWQQDNVLGGQVLYPTTGDDFRPVPALVAAVEEALRLPGVHLSIRLGGTVVLAGWEAALAALEQALPRVERSGRTYPLRLPLHSAFHTPLMEQTSARARRELADLPLRAPTVPLFTGDARVLRWWADPAELLAYTLGPQVTTPFDLTAAVTTALGELGPDAVLLPGPGNTLGAPIAQILIAAGWRGLRDRRDLDEAQKSATPLVISMARPEQRALVTAPERG